MPLGLTIIVPCYGHSNLVRESVLSALDQECQPEYNIVMINDGCATSETDLVGRTYAATHAGRFFYLRNFNRGLGGARNAGIAFALANFPSVNYFFFLDADNRLLPGFITRSLELLKEHHDADLLYFSQMAFSATDYYDNSGQYSLAEHLISNPADAGSFVRADVFRNGLRYYTDKPLGYEDWQLSLTIGSSGGRLVHVDNPGFLYRKRPESMITGSVDEHASLMASIRKSLNAFISHQNIIAEEHALFPRYAIWEVDRRQVRLVTDPAAPGLNMPAAEASRNLLATRYEPRRAYMPVVHLMLSSEVLHDLSDSKMLRMLLLKCERAFTDGAIFVYGSFRFEDSDVVSITELLPTQELLDQDLCFVAFRSSMLLDCAADETAYDWLVNGLRRGAVIPTSTYLQIHAPSFLRTRDPADDDLRGTSIRLFMTGVLRRMRRVWSKEPLTRRFDHKSVYLPDRRDGASIRTSAMTYGPIHPKITAGGRGRATIAVPFCDYGGVEKIALNVARLLKILGFDVTLLVTGANRAHLPHYLAASLDGVVFLDDTEAGRWQTAPGYFGTTLPVAQRAESLARLRGLLSGSDVVFNFHAGELHGVMRETRRTGAVTIAALQVVDVSRHGNPVGHPYSTAAYEHVYDWIIVPSQGLADFCISHGLPTQKVAVVPNGPGFPITPTEATEAIAAREARASSTPLRLLFLGRLDFQKGVDVLVEIIKRTVGRPDLEWRVVGSVVVDGQAEIVDEIEALVGEIEPPVRTQEAVRDALAWCDILVLPSRFEGVPLTIVEAMSLGAVVLSTEVGATSEFVSRGEDCLLFPFDDHLATDITAAIVELVSDLPRRQAIGRAASRRALQSSWDSSLPLIASLVQRASPKGKT